MDSRAGEKIFLAKFTHLGSFAANFDEKISKKSNFQKWSQMGSNGTPFWTPFLDPIVGRHFGPHFGKC